jgi:hypothetical protein
MPSYRNEQHAFEIDLPADWSITRGLARIPVVLSNVIMRANILEEFSCGPDQWLNIVVERMIPEPPPETNEMAFSLIAQDRNYTDLEFGRITVAGRLHAWARYVMLSRVWVKKYLIVLNGHGYAITASSSSQDKLPAYEKTWDCIATSLRLIGPVSDSIAALNDTPSARRTLEKLREAYEMRLKERRHS